MPVEIVDAPLPSRSTATSMSVSLVLRFTVAVRMAVSFICAAFYQGSAGFATFRRPLEPALPGPAAGQPPIPRTFSTVSDRQPPVGVCHSMDWPTDRPISAAPTGVRIEILPASMSASCGIDQGHRPHLAGGFVAIFDHWRPW